MRISDQYIALMSGYMRIKHRDKFVVEINWDIKTWAIPLEIDFG